MSDMNVFAFTGRLTKDAVVKTVGATGTSLTEFDVATSTGFGDKKDTLYVTCNMWGKRGTSVSKFLEKGKPVGVSGVLSMNKWTAHNGEERSKLVVNVSDLTLLPDSKGGGACASDIDDDVMF